MMKIKAITGVLLLVLISLQVKAEWFINREHKYKINIPANWSSNSYQDGTDKVYDFYSPDENIAIQLRSFKASAGVTLDVLIDVYEQNMLPAGNQRKGLFDKVSKNGIPGKEGVYTAMYNGTSVTMGAFYAVPNNYCYVLLIIVPTNMLEQKSNEIKAITKTFFVDGFSATDATVQKSKANSRTRASDLGGLIGKSGFGSTNKSNDVIGRYEFSHRSDGKILVNYHYIILSANHTYTEKYNPKDSGNYEGGTSGSWDKEGNTIYLTHKGDRITDTYVLNGHKLLRTSGNGVTFTFIKK